MQKFILTLVIIIFSNVIIYAQSEFRNGYIIKNNNDTIFGLIDYRGNIANSKQCIFKKVATSEVIEFAPNEIKAYRFIDSKYYVSKQVETNQTKDLLFLEFLINGIVDIYYYSDQYNVHYLVDNGDSILRELKNEKKTIEKNNIEYQKESKEYIGMLKYIFQKSPLVSKKTENVSLTSKSLISITKEYHNSICTNEECIIYEKKFPKLKPKFGFGALIGLNIFNENILDRKVRYLKQGQLKTEYTPSFGFLLKISIPNLSKNIQLEYSTTFNRKISALIGGYSPIYSSAITNSNYNSLKQYSFNNSLHLRYEYAKGKFRPTLKLGYFCNFFTNGEYINKYNSTWYNGNPYVGFVYYDKLLPKTNYGISFGAGVNMKIASRYKVFLDFTYQLAPEITNYEQETRIYKNLRTNSFSLELGILFGK